MGIGHFVLSKIHGSTQTFLKSSLLYLELLINFNFFHFQVVKDENKEKMVPLDWTPAMRLSAWSDMVAHVGPAGSGKQVRAAG